MTALDKQIQTKIETIRLINTYASLLKDTGLEGVSGEVFSCIDANSQLNDELEKLISYRPTSS